MAPETKSRLGAPLFKPEVFRKQVYCIEKSIYDIIGIFRRSLQSFGALEVI